MWSLLSHHLLVYLTFGETTFHGRKHLSGVPKIIFLPAKAPQQVLFMIYIPGVGAAYHLPESLGWLLKLR